MLHEMRRLENKQKNLMVVQILESHLRCSELTKQPWEEGKAVKEEETAKLTRGLDGGNFPSVFGFISSTAEAMTPCEGVGWLG